MPTFVIPEDFEGQFNLLGKIKMKVDADGVASPINGFLAEHLIVLADDIIAGNAAKAQDDIRKSNELLSQNFIQLRDLDFDPVFLNTRGEMQYLKLFLSPNYKGLGVWGLTVVAPALIVYPSNFLERTDLFYKIKTQYDTYPTGTSPLDPYLIKKAISMANDAIKVQDAITNNTKADAATKLSEGGTENRNLKWKTPLEHLHLICNILMILFSGNEKALGEYGITVTEDKKPDVLRTSTIIAGEQKKFTSIVIGSVLTNTGTVDIIVYKGQKIKGTGTTVSAGGKLGMTKGNSTIIVVNTSTTVTAKFTITVMR